VYVTPDGERTMATFLGACGTLTQQDVDAELIKRAKLLYIEGYLWDRLDAIAAIESALTIAKNVGVKTAFTLSDTFCVTRHREAFKQLAAKVDVLFANEAEACALYEVSTLAEALTQLQKNPNIAAITRSGDGATIVAHGTITDVSAPRVANVVDTTGAGDLFAAGFLFGHLRGQDVTQAAKLGHALAGHIIQQLGPRSAEPLKKVVGG
jgi:sugar/nucleoside kinase (ribokinase family)